MLVYLFNIPSEIAAHSDTMFSLYFDYLLFHIFPILVLRAESLQFLVFAYFLLFDVIVIPEDYVGLTPSQTLT